MLTLCVVVYKVVLADCLKGAQMSLIKRFSDVVRANLNALVDAAEDPEKMLEQSIIEMKEQEQRGKKKLFEITVLYKQALKHIQTKCKAWPEAMKTKHEASWHKSRPCRSE
jgi:hypothetical protein